MNKLLGLLLLSPFILIILIFQVLWLPLIFILGAITLPFVVGMALYDGDSVTDTLETLSPLAFAPIIFLQSMLEIK